SRCAALVVRTPAMDLVRTVGILETDASISAALWRVLLATCTRPRTPDPSTPDWPRDACRSLSYRWSAGPPASLVRMLRAGSRATADRSHPEIQDSHPDPAHLFPAHLDRSRTPQRGTALRYSAYSGPNFERSLGSS